MATRYFENTIILKVLTRDAAIGDDTPLSVIDHETVEGEWVASDMELQTREIDGPAAARLLLASGSEPGFFGLDDEGQPVEE